MGTFHATIDIGDPQGQRWQAVDTLVDTGSAYTWLPRQILERLSVEPQTTRGGAVNRQIVFLASGMIGGMQSGSSHRTQDHKAPGE